MLDGIDEALIGLAAGESKTFAAPLAGGDRAGEDAEITVTLGTVKERELPELDDDFAQLASEFDTLDELFEDITKQARQSKMFEQGVQARDKMLELLLDTIDVRGARGPGRARGAPPPRGREPPRRRRAPRRGHREHQQGAARPVPSRRDRRAARGRGRAGRADRVPGDDRPAVRHGARPVRPGHGPEPAGWRDGLRSRPPQGARGGAGAGPGGRQQRRRRRPVGRYRDRRPRRGRHRERRGGAAARPPPPTQPRERTRSRMRSSPTTHPPTRPLPTRPLPTRPLPSRLRPRQTRRLPRPPTRRLPRPTPPTRRRPRPPTRRRPPRRSRPRRPRRRTPRRTP